MKLWIALGLVLLLATSAFGLESKAYQLREDFGTEPTYDGALQYYYYIPCPTYSWFWAFSGFAPGDMLGAVFTIGDQGTGGYDPLDPAICHELEQFRILDFAGYGTVYPGLFTVEFSVYCAGADYCPVGAPIWLSGPLETHFAWNYFLVDPPLCLTPCYDPPADFNVLLMAHHIGTEGTYPAWGCDNISTTLEQACILHDLGCLPVVYPRTSSRTGFYGIGGVPSYCPPQYFCDGRDTTPDCTQFGRIELAWRLYLICGGPTANESSTWGNIKSMYE
jgi:hypothetical protein